MGELCFKGILFWGNGENLRGWITMLLNGAKTCIKANGFVSKYFPISCSCTQGYLIAPLIYILSNRNNGVCFKGDRDNKGVKLPGEGDIDSLESKLCMFADDTQIINKDEDSLKKSFDVLSLYEIDSV